MSANYYYSRLQGDRLARGSSNQALAALRVRRSHIKTSRTELAQQNASITRDMPLDHDAIDLLPSLQETGHDALPSRE